jgi:hypothetical protein
MIEYCSQWAGNPRSTYARTCNVLQKFCSVFVTSQAAILFYVDPRPEQGHYRWNSSRDLVMVA